MIIRLNFSNDSSPRPDSHGSADLRPRFRWG
jgi:hypothetical protein